MHSQKCYKKGVKTHIFSLIRPFLLILLTLSGTCEYAFLEYTFICLWDYTLYFADRVILDAYRCIEENNFDFKRLFGALLPLLFAFRGDQQSTFPLFIDWFRLRCNSGILLLPLFMSVVPVASPLSLVDGVVFTGQSDVLSATRFLAVVFFFVACAELISSRRSRSRGVSVVNLPRCGFAASCWIQRCCVFAVLRYLNLL